MTGGKTRLKIWLVVVGVFILGCVTGASFSSVYRLQASNDEPQDARGGRRGKEDLFESMKRDLSLNDSQATEVRAILDQTRNDYRALRPRCAPLRRHTTESARPYKALLTRSSNRFSIPSRGARRPRDKEDKESIEITLSTLEKVLRIQDAKRTDDLILAAPGILISLLTSFIESALDSRTRTRLSWGLHNKRKIIRKDHAIAR